MLQITQSINTPASSVAGRLNSNWKRILFFFQQRAFESKLEGILRAASGHEVNSLPAGSLEYRVLAARADELSAEFADSWGLDVEFVKANIPGMAKLAGLAVAPPRKNYSTLAFIVIIATLLPLVVGILGALISVGYHVGGGR